MLARAPQFAELFQRGDGFQFRQRVVFLKSFEDCDFFAPVRISQAQPQQKAVQLGFRQREGPFQFDGVLCRDHQKRDGQPHGLPVDGHLALLHTFQQTRLGPGNRPVDFIGQ
ncbi:MAG: hypothetical protein Q8O57_03210, partial [Kiritimatiellota bacterium]|nr:hypothetical protein [Kiritimatiellota bacterium]